ncbi:hypothetical protein SAMN05192561_1011094 [Halopenitus malekzadehii]|uniref:t-SNARE coiled-coil homology domain-containing protein n=1 Tax=Halopenitus malekzadehii TaxID=1267564 RepID=A0A1H6I5G4_9EURY|nr:hypothetical protein [Halopenitus malekzadehii]SEH43916.1 hypothetical protein SAMN05192561_1011094 [Halopenitus malekzadehii]
MSDPQRSERVVEADGITVEKSFATDEFPVPAVTFRIESARSEPVRVRLTDTIPDDFPMERVGFHPDFESEHWTAYSDHRVEFDRLLEPGATVRTVFGIRGDGIDPDAFLTPPTVDHVPEGESIEDVLGADGNDPVREVVAGDRDSLPGMEDEERSAVNGHTDADVAADTGAAADADAADAADGEDEAPSPNSMDADTSPAVTAATSVTVDDRNAGEGADGDTEADADTAVDVDAATDDDGADDRETIDDDSDEAAGEPGAVDVSVASALAAEIRSGDVPEADLETLREELDLGTPRSVDVRISRLQSRIEDLAAYADALEEFIDEEGTATEVLESTREQVEDVATALDAAEARIDEAADARRSVREDLNAVEGTLDDALDDVADLEDRVADVESIEPAVADLETTVTDLEATVEDVDGTVAVLDEEMGDVRSDIADLDTRVHDLEDVDGDVETLESEIDRIDDELAELEAFRDRLSDAFGT